MECLPHDPISTRDVLIVTAFSLCALWCAYKAGEAYWFFAKLRRRCGDSILSALAGVVVSAAALFGAFVLVGSGVAHLLGFAQ